VFIKKLGLLFCLSALFVAGPARAERMMFDHRSYPALKATLDSGNQDLILYNDRNPKYVYDLIVIQGISTSNWTEGLEIITRISGRNMARARDWLEEMRRAQSPNCASEFSILGEDANSITFERRSPGCPQTGARAGIYKIIAGKRSLFLLGGLFKGEMRPDMRQQWLALFATAMLS